MCEVSKTLSKSFYKNNRELVTNFSTKTKNGKGNEHYSNITKVQIFIETWENHLYN